VTVLQVAEAVGLADNSRLVVTAGLVVPFVLLSGVVYQFGGRLKTLLGDEDAGEAVQSAAVTVLGTAAAVVLVDIWNLSRELGLAFDAVLPAEPAEAGVRLMTSLLVFGAAYTFTRITKRIIKLESDRDAISAHRKEIGHHIVQILVFLPAFLFVMALWGSRPAALLLGAGAFGIVIGLATRQTLGPVLAGFVLLLARPFEIGDWVMVADEEVVNRSRSDQLRVTVDVGVDYDVNVTDAARIAESAMEGCDEVVDSPRPDVVIDQFGASSVVLTLRFRIDEPTIQRKWAARNAVVEAVKDAFEREGSKVPYPQRELSGRPETDGLQVARAREVSAEDESGPDPDDGDGGESADAGEEDGGDEPSTDQRTAVADGGPAATPAEEGANDGDEDENA
jgi:small-conductance mechanosensitive channel